MIGTIFITFLIMLALGLPIALAVGITALLPGILNPLLPANAEYVFRGIVTSMDSTSLLAVPLFIFSGNIMAKGGISQRLFDFFAYFIGDRTGGLPATVVVTCLFYGAISGSAPATVAAVGAMTIPLLIRLGYDKVWVTALVAVAGGLGVIIPPSIPFIMYGLAANESVGKLFTAGILPGILIGICLILYAVFYCKVHGEDKELLHTHCSKLRAMGLYGIIKESFWALMTPVLILGGIYNGIVTPTEAADISVIYALVVSLFIYKGLKLKDLSDVLRDSIRTTAPALLVAAMATVFGRVLTLMQAPQMIAGALTSTFTNRIVLLLVINIFLLFVGMIMETLSAILILTPIFLPVITAIGMNPIHFGIMMVVNLAIGFVTPPIGVNLYVASSLSDIPVMSIAKKAVPFMIAFLIALMIITFVPQISLLLVS